MGHTQTMGVRSSWRAAAVCKTVPLWWVGSNPSTPTNSRMIYLSPREIPVSACGVIKRKKAEEDARPAVAPKTMGMKPGSFFFIHKDMKKKDKELFFGPLDGSEEFEVFDDTWIMAHVLVHVGLFPSLSQARKNGGDGPIKEGFSDFTRGKNQRRKEITILNKF